MSFCVNKGNHCGLPSLRQTTSLHVFEVAWVRGMACWMHEGFKADERTSWLRMIRGNRQGLKGFSQVSMAEAALDQLDKSEEVTKMVGRLTGASSGADEGDPFLSERRAD